MTAVKDIVQLILQGQEDADQRSTRIVGALQSYGIVTALLLSSASEDTIKAVASKSCENVQDESKEQEKRNAETVIAAAVKEADGQLRILHERSLKEKRVRANKVDLSALCRTASEAGSKLSFLLNMLPPLPAVKKVIDNPLMQGYEFQ
ncbi:hypothetical protein FOL47_011089 [Perkinsus chesapeaki]|uniref:Uncharacterized protein n=1 Tax=Perkinsus chesapeaki TaxID=330153 RepID=A0A7J6KYK4_PERCH|nr:hypothetical protein FOL47_011089 [Perkinsus chesapeaki]